MKRLENILVNTGFIDTFTQSNSNIRMLWLNDKGRFELGKHGTYSIYRESLKPKESNEDKVMNYLKRLPVHSPKISANKVFEDCRIDKNEMDFILNSMKASGSMEIQSFKEDHLIWLTNNRSPISVNQVTTHGDFSPESFGDMKAENFGNKTSEEGQETKQLAKEQLKDLPKSKWYRKGTLIVSVIAILEAIIIAILQWK